MNYKVVTEDLKSLGLRKNPNVMTFYINKFVKEKNRLEKNNKDYGGIWCAVNLSNAKRLSKYIKQKYNKETKIFMVEIGKILYQNSYRVKTDKVKLINQWTG